MEKVLISGGTGLVGRHLCAFLKGNGFEVSILRRQSTVKSEYKSYAWNPGINEIDPESIRNADYIIHLAGENIAEKKWTVSRKKQLIASRVDTANLIFSGVIELNAKPRAFITASAVGYYGAVSGTKIFNENDKPGTDFLAQTCVEWERAADQFAAMGTRTVKLRTGVVLADSGGILGRLTLLIKMFVSVQFGNGSQYMPWIHIDDLCRLYLYAISNKKMEGAYNAAALEHITNREFMKELSLKTNRPLIRLAIPGFMLRMVFGEMASVLLTGSRVSSEKITNTGFEFSFPTIKQALSDLYAKAKSR